MKEISVVLLVQVVLYKFKGDCSLWKAGAQAFSSSF